MTIKEDPRIIFYTDCFVFGGCEKPIFEVMNSPLFNEKFDHRLIYRKTREYETGMKAAFPDIQQEMVRGVRFPDADTAGFALKRILGTGVIYKTGLYAVRAALRILAPLIMLFEMIVLAIMFRQYKAKYVHINNGGYPGAISCHAAALAARLSGAKRVFFSVNNTAFEQKNLFERSLDHIIGRCVDMFVTGSKASGKALVEKRGLAQNKMVNIYHGVRMPELSRIKRPPLMAPGKRYITMVARFEERKGHACALSAFKLLTEQMHGVELILIGDGPLQEAIKKMAGDIGIGERVRFLGHRGDYASYIAHSEFLINPSLGYEDLPYVILEAMSLGVAVIGTSIAGIPEELEDQKTGFIVEPGNEQELAARMRQLLADKEMNMRMGKEARKRFEQNFTVEKMISGYVKLYSGQVN